MKIISYQSPNGGTINLTRPQIAGLRKSGIWPRDGRGAEYCTVSHGLHDGQPTFSSGEIGEILAGANVVASRTFRV